MTATAIIQSIRVDLIDAQSFVRTQNGNDKESLRELAASIKEHGLIQPIVVRRLADQVGPGSHEKFAIIAGRRRLAAAKLAGIGELPCLISGSDESKAYELEIAENIQREQMTLGDTARAIRTLMMIHGSAKTVQRIVNKSSAWVSKRLTITANAFPPELAEMLENGTVGDLETLLLMAQVKKLDTSNRYAALLTMAVEGRLNRQIAKATLDALKEKKPKDGQAREEGEAEEGGEEDECTTKQGLKGLTKSQALRLIDEVQASSKSAHDSIVNGNPVAARVMLRELLDKLDQARASFASE